MEYSTGIRASPCVQYSISWHLAGVSSVEYSIRWSYILTKSKLFRVFETLEKRSAV